MKSDTDNRIKALHAKAHGLIRQGMNEDEITEELKQEGIESSYAQMIIENVKSDIRDRSDARKLVLMGSFFIVGGIYINYFSYLIAAHANATFFYLFWGIIVTGFLLLVRAYYLFPK